MPLSKKRKTLYVLLGILAVLIILRICLSPMLKWYLNNKVLADMGVYTGHVDDVDLMLFRGAYAIDSLQIYKKESALDSIFVSCPRMDLSIEWKSLLKGSLVGEIEAYEPVVNFAFSPVAARSQTGEETDWTEVVGEMMPIRINRFSVDGGQLRLINLFQATKTDVAIKNFDLEVTNIQNAADKEAALPSEVYATAIAPDYSGLLRFTAKANFFKRIPDFDYNARFENVDITSLNPLIEQAAGIDFEKGELDLYSEMVMQDGRYKGYLKPLATDLVIFRPDENDPKGEKRSPWQFVKELFAEGAKEVVENQEKQLFATVVPIEGDLAKGKTDIWTAITKAFYNGYVKALQAQVDGTVSYAGLRAGEKEANKKKEKE